MPGPATPCDLESGTGRLERLQSLWRTYGDCFRVPAQSRDADTWVVTDPEAIGRVLVGNHRNYTKGVGIERVRVLLGNGLMTAEGAHWRRQRRMLQPAFHKAALSHCLPAFHEQARALTADWKHAAGAGRAVNVTAAVSDSALAAVLRALFSEDLDSLRDAQGRLPFDLVSDERRRDLQFAVRLRSLGTLIREVAERRRRERRYPPDLLSHCLQARERGSGEAMSERQLVDEILTLIVAGHETTAASLGWVWYLLSAHPGHFRQMAEALDARETSATPDWETLARWQPVTQVIREALRLYPPGWLYTRRALDDDRLAGYRVPAGSDVFICTWLLHRHPGWWERPDEFLPQRFGEQEQAPRHRYVYLPFSAGPRHCIGETFAMAEMQIHLATVASELRPVPAGDLQVACEADVNLRPREPLHLRFEVRRG